MNKTSDTVIIAHDYLCPWCWIGFFQAKRLKEEFPDIKQDWIGFELLPEELGPLPDFKPRPRDPDKPKSRLEILSELDNILIPDNRTIGVVRTHDALQGVEYAKEHAPELLDRYNEMVYRAFWERSEDISSHDVLGAIAENIGLDRVDFLNRISAKEYSHKIVGFDDGAYAVDITHVPTFIFRGERCAEAPYSTIRGMVERFQAWYKN
jgi:predicted DsbA family dithiol-disulfide isomerase